MRSVATLTLVAFVTSTVAPVALAVDAPPAYDAAALCDAFRRESGTAGRLGGSAFRPDEVYCAIIEYYGFSAGLSPGSDQLTSADKHEMADALADMLAILAPESFNDVMGHLVVDYRQHPRFRAGLEDLMSTTYSKISEELHRTRDQHPVVTVIDDVFKVWGVVYVFGFGRGLWRSRGSGLKGLEKFRHIVKTVSTNLPRSRRAMLAIAGVGTTIGIVEAIYNHLETKKLDPRELLRSVQSEAVTGLATTIVVLRDELRPVTQAQVRAGPERYRTRVLEVRAQVRGLLTEVEHLYAAAEPLRSQLQPVAQDLRSVRESLERIEGWLYELGFDAEAPAGGAGSGGFFDSPLP